MSVDLDAYDRVWICGAGKASGAMAQGLAELVSDRLAGGLVVTKESLELPPPIRNLVAGHPIPDIRSLAAGGEMVDLASGMNDKDLVLFALSGGASALIESLVLPLTLDDLQATNRILLNSGAPIEQINEVRKRLSNIKNGGLGRAFSAANVICFVLSDMPGGEFETVGSAPLFSSVLSPLADIPGGLPESVKRILGSPQHAMQPSQVFHLLLGNGQTAAEAARDAATQLGLEAFEETAPFRGDAADLGRQLARLALELPPNSCHVSWGESTVTVEGADGRGGRAQEAALLAAIELNGPENVAILVAGTDGTDGPTDAAGAVVTGDSVNNAKSEGVDAQDCLGRHDSYRFHQAAGTHVVTGPTGTNLNELAILVRLD